MKTGWLIMLAGFASSGAVFAEIDTANPHQYQSIIDRNPFNVRPPQPPPPPPPEQKEQPKLDIYLTGVSSLLGPPKAFLKVQQHGTAGPKYYDLGVDDKKDGIEVLEINHLDRSVRIRNQGAEMLLTFETHAAKAVSAPVVAAAPNQRPGIQTAAARRAAVGAGAAGNPALALNRPATPAGMVPPPGQTGAVQDRIRNIPSRTLRVQPEQGSAGAGVSGVALDPAMAQRYGLRTQPQSPPHQDLHHNLSPEQQVLMLELQRAANPHIPLPPTPGMPPELSGGGGFPPVPE